MNLDSNSTRTSAETAWADFVRWIGFSTLVESVERKQKSLEDWSAFKDIAPRLFSIENGLAATIQRWRSTHKLSYPHDKATYDAYLFVGACVKIAQHLTLDQARRFRRRVISEILPNGRMCHLDHEFRTLRNLTEFGWDIVHYGFCGDPGPDFVARRHGIEIEVESKCLSPEIGLGLSYEFCARLLSRLSKAIRPMYPRCLTTIRVEILSSNSSGGTAEIENQILTAYNLKTNYSSGFIRIHIENSSLDEFFIKFPNVKSKNWLHTTFKAIRTREGDYGYFIRRDDELIFCNLVPIKENQQVKKVLRLVSSTCERQFSKERPALLWLHLQALEYSQMQNDTKWNAGFLGAIARHAFTSDRRTHVMSLVFTSDSELYHDRRGFYGRSRRHVTSTGNLKGFDNPRCRFDPVHILAPSFPLETK